MEERSCYTCAQLQIILEPMKNKTVAGVLALVAGYMGLHRFYLGQVGLGIMYILLLPVFLVTGLWFFFFIGIVDAIALFSMDQDAFNKKYNKGFEGQWQNERRRDNRDVRDYNRNERYRERQTQKAPSTRKSRATRRNTPYMKSGKEKFKDYDYEGAIADFNKALEVDPQNIAVHFNLACAHSLMEHKDKAFYHLDRAVALGFDDFNTIKTRDHLAFLRIQPEFLQFEANNFRLAKQLNAPKENLLDETPVQSSPEQTDLLEQLQKLAQLKEKGLLTEEEFKVQKEKLLG